MAPHKSTRVRSSTARSRISISDIRIKKNGERNPLIVEFQNGDVLRDNVREFKARLISHDELGNKAVEVFTKDGQKFVNPMIGSSRSNRFVVIKNKKSKKVKLIEVDFISLINQLHGKKKATEINKGEMSLPELNRSLKKTFGTKKAVRALKESELFKIDKSLVEDQINEALIDNKINESSINVSEGDNTASLLPPCNRDAKTLEEVYKISDCLSNEELLILENIARKLLKNEDDTSKYTEFFKAYLKQILNTHGNHQKKICCLLYASALITYVKAPAKSLRKIASSLCPYSTVISQKIITEFCVKTGPLLNRPLAMKDKATCHAIVLLAIANDFKIDLEMLAKQSGYGFKKMKQLGRLVGLVPASKNSSTYVLSLPLPPPPKMVKSFKMKTTIF